MRATMRFWLCFFAALCLAACGGGDPGGDGDGGTDTDTDTDTDADADGGADGGSESCSPEILDEGTGLYWLQCMAGQCLIDDACAWEGGEVLSLNYDEAAAACPSGYRLPTIAEIMGLLGNCDDIDLGVNETGFCDACPVSAACNAVYPGVDALGSYTYEILHWSSTALNDSTVWWSNFKTGLVEAKSKEMNGTAVCVRSE
jgi:hypothetical protein